MYILTNKHRKVLYTGITSDLIVRIPQHIYKIRPFSFTAQYNCDKLVYHESFESIENAIAREKQIKGWKRNRKILLIESLNPGWEDLFERDVKHW